jgi:glycosyltransferase involved in cell wall biosynthesis
MRLLVLTNRFPRPANPTVATYNLVQCRAMAKSHDVRVVAPVPWTEEARDLLHRRLPVREHRSFGGLEVHHPSVLFLPRAMLHKFGEQYLRSVRATVMRVAREQQPDAIFSCWAHPDGWAAVQIARELGVPVIVKVIGSDVLVATKDRRRRALIADTLIGADAVVAVGEDLAKHVVELGVDARHVSVVSEGTDTDVFHPGGRDEARARLGIPKDERTILFVGNVLVSKGILDLVEACAALARTGASFHCRVVGGGADRARAEELARKREVADRMTFHGACAHDELGDWYRACDFLTLPSHSEGIPNVLREVELCGRPYVATRVGGVGEIAKPDVSVLVPARDVPALAAALGEMLARPYTVDPAKARERHITPAASAQMIVDRFEAILAAR